VEVVPSASGAQALVFAPGWVGRGGRRSRWARAARTTARKAPEGVEPQPANSFPRIATKLGQSLATFGPLWRGRRI
jgi:hypothetical protein